jgi:hypothetical protein
VLSAPPRRFADFTWTHIASIIVGADDGANDLVLLADLIIEVLLLLSSSIAVRARVDSFVTLLEAIDCCYLGLVLPCLEGWKGISSTTKAIAQILMPRVWHRVTAVIIIGAAVRESRCFILLINFAHVNVLNLLSLLLLILSAFIFSLISTSFIKDSLCSRWAS